MSLFPQSTRMHTKTFSIPERRNKSPLDRYKFSRNLLTRQKMKNKIDKSNW